MRLITGLEFSEKDAKAIEDGALGVEQATTNALNEELEMGVQELCLEAIKKGIIKSAHDLSDGGLAVCIAEKVVQSKGDIGAKKILENNKNKILYLSINDQEIIKNYNSVDDFIN